MILFAGFLDSLFPNAVKIIVHCERRAWKNLPDLGKKIRVVPITKDDVVDVARDNAHPGIKSHRKIAEKIYNSMT